MKRPARRVPRSSSINKSVAFVPQIPKSISQTDSISSDTAPISEIVVPEVDIDAPLQAEEIPPVSAVSSTDTHDSRTFFLGFLLTAIVIGATLGLFYLFITLEQESTTQHVASTEQDVHTEPTSTPTHTFSASAISIDILNGSGVAGMAGKVADELNQKGYSVVTIGNADARKTSTVLSIDSQHQADVDRIRHDIESVVTVDSVEVLSSGTVSAQLVIGKQ